MSKMFPSARISGAQFGFTMHNKLGSKSLFFEKAASIQIFLKKGLNIMEMVLPATLGIYVLTSGPSRCRNKALHQRFYNI